MGSIAYNSPDLFTNSYYNAYEKEIANQRVQAEVMKLMEEAKLKAEMQPFDIDYKKAMTNQANAQAEASLRDKTDPWKKAQASMSERQALLPIIAAYGRSGQFDAMLADPSIPQSFKDSFSKLPKEAQQQWLDGYIGNAPIQKDAATVRAAELRAGATLGSKAIDKEIAAMKLKAKTLGAKATQMKIPKTEVEMANRYLMLAEQARAAGNDELATQYLNEASAQYTQAESMARIRGQAAQEVKPYVKDGKIVKDTPKQTQNPAETRLVKPYVTPGGRESGSSIGMGPATVDPATARAILKQQEQQGKK